MGVCIKILNLTDEEINEIQEFQSNKIYNILNKNAIAHAQKHKQNEDSNKTTRNKNSTSCEIPRYNKNKHINKNLSRDYKKSSMTTRPGYGTTGFQSYEEYDYQDQ